MHTYAITITHSIRTLGLQPSRLSKGSLGAVKLSESGDLSSPQRPAPSISHKIYREANTGCDKDTAVRRREIKRVCVGLDKSQAATLMLSCSLKFCGFFMMRERQDGKAKGQRRSCAV